MRQLYRPMIPLVTLLIAAAPMAYGQGGGTSASGSGATSSGLGFGGGGLGSGSAGGNGAGVGSTGGTTGGRASGSGGTTSATLSASNFLAASYVYPYSTGLYTNSTLASGSTSAGGSTSGSGSSSGSSTSNTAVPPLAATFFVTSTYGTPLYTITTTTSKGGTATIKSGTASTTTNNGDYGPTISGTRYPHVGTTIKFAAPAKSTDQLLGEVRDVVQRSSSIKSKNTIKIEVNDRVVRLTGTVADEDERSHIATLISMSESVRGVVNELQVK